MRDVSRRGLMAGLTALTLSEPAAAQQMREVRIAVSSGSMAAAVTRIASEMGLFAKQNLTPRNIIMESGNAASLALISRSVDFAISGPSELIAAQARGQRIVALATAYGAGAGVLVLDKKVAAGLPVGVDARIGDRLKALNGLLIAAISPTSISPLSLRLAAKDAGGNVRYTYMSQEAMPAALDSEAVQGIFASAPMWAAPVAKGTGTRWLAAFELPYKFKPTHAVNLQTMKTFADQNADLMKGMLAVLNELSLAIDNRPAEVKAALARLYPKIDETSLDVLYGVEAPLWKARTISEADMMQEIELIKGTAVTEAMAKDLDPAAMLYRP